MLMCRKHLLGEHVEMHMLAGSINKGISMQGYIDNGLVNLEFIEDRHRQLVAEMLERGYNHKSPLPKIKTIAGPVGSVDSAANLKELARRCRECRKRMEDQSIPEMLLV